MVKNILVTGGLGFIGANFIENCLERDFCVTNLDLGTYASINPKIFKNHNNYNHYLCDIRNFNEVKKYLILVQPNFVVHFAAETHVDNSILSPQRFIETNINGTFNLLEALRQAINDDLLPKNTRMHHVSTDEVYGTLGAVGSFTEETPYAPNSPYSASKAASDHLVNAWFHTYGLNVTWTNCSNNFGKYQNVEKLIPKVIDNFLLGKKVPIYGDGQNIRDWLYVNDHVDALLNVLDNCPAGKHYNIGGGFEISNLSLVNLIAELLSKKTNKPLTDYNKLITFVPDRPGHDFRYSIDNQKILSDLNWKPLYDFEEALSETIDYYISVKRI